MLFNSLSLIAGILYIIVGSFVIITKSFGTKLEPIPAYVLGNILCAYGVFRIIRAIIRIKKKNETH